MWTPTTREQHSRKALRYQTDLTDAEWVVIEPHLPPAHCTGRPRSWPMREIVNGNCYVIAGWLSLAPAAKRFARSVRARSIAGSP